MTGFILKVIVISLLHYSSATWSKSLEETLKSQHYDKKLPPPTEDGKPVIVTNQMYIQQLSDFRTDVFTYDIDYILRQWWKDPRLARNFSRKETTKVYHQENDQLTYNRDVGIWRPILSVSNSDAAQTFKDERHLMRINRNSGDVYRSAKKKSR